MRIAVAGGTGLVGRELVGVLHALRHEPAVISRAAGVDLLTGEGLREALEGAAAVIDVTNTPAVEPERAEAFFATATGNLIAAEQALGVQHHVLLSILGLERVVGNGHYAGKRIQERLVREAGTPATIVRATQFFDFAEMVVRWTLRDHSALLPPLLIQPLAVSDLARVLAEAATGGPASVPVEVAGPEPQDLVDMARRTLATRGASVKLVPSWRGPFSTEMAGEVLLPASTAELTRTTFDEWLDGLSSAPGRPQAPA